MKPIWAHPCSAKAYIQTQFLRVMEYVGSKAVCWYCCDTGDVTSIRRKLTKPSSHICLLSFFQDAMDNPTTHPPHHLCTPPPQRPHQPTTPPHRGGGGHPSHGGGVDPRSTGSYIHTQSYSNWGAGCRHPKPSLHFLRERAVTLPQTPEGLRPA